MNGETDRSGLLELLRGLVRERRTGTLYVHTDDNHLIAFGLDGGSIVSLLAGPRQGERAIPTVRAMRWGSFRLDEDIPPQRRRGCRVPSAEELLARLERDEDEDEDEAWTPPRPAAAAAGPRGGDAEHVQGVLCRVLASYLGPIAPLVCKQTMTAVGGVDTADKLKRVVETLALEIEDAAEAEHFRTRARRELGSLLV